MLQETLEMMYGDLLQEALYLQKAEIQKSQILIETNGQHFNFEPLVWAIIALAINEFIKGVFSGLGKGVSDLITEKLRRKQIKEKEEIFLMIEDDLQEIKKILNNYEATKKNYDEGLIQMKKYLILSGIPSYKASALVERWKDDLIAISFGKEKDKITYKRTPKSDKQE
jgi:hypothetical protein